VEGEVIGQEIQPPVEICRANSVPFNHVCNCLHGCCEVASSFSCKTPSCQLCLWRWPLPPVYSSHPPLRGAPFSPPPFWSQVRFAKHKYVDCSSPIIITAPCKCKRPRFSYNLVYTRWWLSFQFSTLNNPTTNTQLPTIIPIPIQRARMICEANFDVFAFY
jgi:hypothetical protein